ncbi:MAG TPA: hypothetical protein VNI83_13605 [Vicinamibacterales bacterium]|nr:hypothetical protein [Vicinamibacterales bacterium]
MRTIIALATWAVLAPWPVAAQDPPRAQDQPETQTSRGPLEPRPIVIQHIRPVDQRGIGVFEAPKAPGAPFTGFRLDFNAAFTQQFQDLTHRNQAAPNVVGGVDRNQLMPIGAGFNNATANLYLNAQLARGIRVALTTYLSSRHHPEAWVKDGYLQLDASPIDIELLHRLMRYVTVRVGHFEINYGDAHFRRSDNGNAIYNPFVGNYILDAFTTEIGAEVYVRASGLLAMGAVTGGEIRGTVLSPDARAPAFIGKLGFDRQLRPDVRVRLTGSLYTTDRSANNTLYGGDRAGSRYYFVMENSQATEAAQAWSGLINPGFRSAVTAVQVNPFVKYRGLEFFGVLERAEGRAANEPADRRWTQYAADVVYRALPREQLYAGVRYNRAEGRLAGLPGDVGAERWQLAAGWFITPGILAKVEYVRQDYFGFPVTDIRSGGRFDGLMLEGVVAF